MTALIRGSAIAASRGASVLSLANAHDVSSADEAAGLTFAFDCGLGYGGFGAASSVSCPTSDNGLRSVHGKVRDKDGGVTVDDCEITTIAGMRVTTAARTAFDVGRRDSVGTAIATLDAFTRATEVKPAEVLQVADRHRHVRGRPTGQ